MSALCDYPPITHRGHKIVVERATPGGKPLRIWIPLLDRTATSAEQAKELINDALKQSVEVSPLSEPGEEPPPPRRAGMRL